MSFLNALFISDAYAGNTVSTQSSGLLSMLPMFLLFGLVMYFMVMRPQQKRLKEHTTLMNNISKGDDVLTNGGLMGTIRKVDEDIVYLTIASNIDVMVQKKMIASVLPKGTLKIKSPAKA